MFRKGTNQGKYNEIVNGGAEEVEVDVDTVMNSLDLTDEELKNNFSSTLFFDNGLSKMLLLCFNNNFLMLVSTQ